MITVSIVTFSNRKNFSILNEKFEILKNSIIYLCEINIIKNILIIDNSLKPYFSSLETLNKKIKYKHLDGKNFGYGKAHNLSRLFLDLEKYHLVLNPDIIFLENDVIKNLFEYMETNRDVSLVQPLIKNHPDGTVQKSCKNSPTLLIQVLRGFFNPFLKKVKFFSKYNDWYEMKNIAYSKKSVASEFLSGCFMFFRVADINKIKWFDESFFMYLEDADITRRLSLIGKCIHKPDISIAHVWERGSHKNIKLRLIAIYSFIIYSTKWGLKLL